MRITISGTPGSGKTVVAKELSRKLKLKHYSIGKFMRSIAKKKKYSLMKLSKLAEKSNILDRELDKKQIELKYKNNFVIDGRVSFYFIPNSIKVFLDAKFKIRAERIFHDNRRGEHFSDLLKTEKEIKERAESEKKRYKRYYGVDYLDKKNYDYVLDTTNLTAGESADKIINFIKKHKKLN